jgi:hypothetical protein
MLNVIKPHDSSTRAEGNASDEAQSDRGEPQGRRGGHL